jgi:transposase InsO family protein
MVDISAPSPSALAEEVAEMLKEISTVEQRYDAVIAVIRDGLSVSEVAEKVGVSRQSLYRWMARYEEDGLDGLMERSHRPHYIPHQMAADLEARVAELRRFHPGWGPLRLQHQLSREGIQELPSHMAIYRALVRHGLIEPKAARKKLPEYKRWERGRPMELWQLDVVGGFLLESGEDAKLLTGVDDHSRYCVIAGVMERATARRVCGLFAKALETYGVPEEVLTDNAKVFTGRFALKPTEVLFDKICRENGITHRLTAPRSPTTTGKIERFHRTLRMEFLAGRDPFSSLSDLQAALDAFVAEYNNERPHRSLKMAVPAERFATAGAGEEAPRLPPDLKALDQDRSGDDWVSRIVSSCGTISVSNQVFSVGKHRRGSVIDVKVSEKLLEAWCGMELLKTVVRDSEGVVRKKKAERQPSRKNR